MNTEDSQKIVKRFFEALYYLKSIGKIRGKATFTKEYNIDRWNLNKLEKEPSRDSKASRAGICLETYSSPAGFTIS